MWDGKMEKNPQSAFKHLACLHLLNENVQICADRLIKGKRHKKENNIITISLTHVQKHDATDSRSGCFDFHYHVN